MPKSALLFIIFDTGKYIFIIFDTEKYTSSNDIKIYGSLLEACCSYCNFYEIVLI
jgi:hypothetical protein